MRRRIILVALAVACVAALWSQLPARRTRLEPVDDPRVVRGAFHVHTDRSDGTGTPEHVAHAAASAGLAFVILADHGDATRAADPPRYLDGVLLIDAVEISTTGGHYIALGIGHSPYRLAGEPRDVVDDVRRLGGFGIAAHPDSPKNDLAWRDWQAPIDGLEWLNADSAWRDESRETMVRGLFTYWFRSPEVIASLFDRPSRTLARWDALGKRRQVVAIAGHDAHARMGLRGDWDPSDEEAYSLRVPSYEAAFRAFSVNVILPRPWLGDRKRPSEDAAVLLGAIRAGRVFTVIEGVAGPAVLELGASSAAGPRLMGDRLDGPGRVTATLRPSVKDAQLQLLANGHVVAQGTGPTVGIDHAADSGPTVYRAQVMLPNAPGTPPVQWIVSNPLYAGLAAPRAPRPLLPPRTWAAPAPKDGWRVERHPGSQVSLDSVVLSPGITAWTMNWRLASGAPAGQYAALVVPVPPGPMAKADRLTFAARASRPMRISVQLRVPEGKGLRWQRSLYLSTEPVEHSIALREMTPIEAPPGTPLDLAHVDSILFVVDTVNTTPGAAGEIWVSQLEIAGID